MPYRAKNTFFAGADLQSVPYISGKTSFLPNFSNKTTSVA
jgi:hypothetical protein